MWVRWVATKQKRIHLVNRPVGCESSRTSAPKNDVEDCRLRWRTLATWALNTTLSVAAGTRNTTSKSTSTLPCLQQTWLSEYMNRLAQKQFHLKKINPSILLNGELNEVTTSCRWRILTWIFSLNIHWTLARSHGLWRYLLSIVKTNMQT